MTLFYGGVTDRDRSPEGAAATAVHALGGASAAPDVRRNLRGAVALEAGAAPSEIWSDEDGFAVLHGAPRVTGDPQFEAAARELGRELGAAYPALLAALDRFCLRATA